MTHTDSTIGALLRSVAAGDRAAFALLYDLLATETYSICAHYLPDAGARDSAMTDIWCRVWSHASTLVAGGSAAREEILTWAAERSRSRALTS